MLFLYLFPPFSTASSFPDVSAELCGYLWSSGTARFDSAPGVPKYISRMNPRETFHYLLVLHSLAQNISFLPTTFWDVCLFMEWPCGGPSLLSLCRSGFWRGARTLWACGS